MLSKTMFIAISILLTASHVLTPAIGQAKSGRFLLISDIHFDPFHDPSLFEKLADQPVEHWKQILASSRNLQFSRYGQDTNYSLLKSTLDDALKRIPDPDFIIYPGDSTAHNWQKKYDSMAKHSHLSDPAAYRSFKTKTIQFLARQFRQRWPHTPVVATLGNNDSYCGDYMITPQGPFLSMFANAWAPLLGDSINLSAFRKSFSDHSHYTMRIPSMRHHRVIVFDNVYWSNRYDNACGAATQTPALDQLAWLETVLADSSAAGEKVWLLLHIPAGVNNFVSSNAKQDNYAGPVTYWQQALTSRFAQLVERYGSTIQIVFAGHTHMDDFRIIRLDGKASLLMKIAPSVSPVFGNNPAYQIYDYDCDSGRLKNYRTFFLTNLSTYLELGSAAVPNWDLEYDFQKAYKLPSLNAATVEKLANGIKTDGTIRKAYSDFYDVNGPSAFNAETVYGYSCAILNPTPAKYKACSNAENQIP